MKACLVLSLLASASSQISPFPAHSANEWTWVPVAGSTCMDGKETGVFVKYGSGTGVAIYLEGGAYSVVLLLCQSRRRQGCLTCRTVHALLSSPPLSSDRLSL